MNKKLLLGLVIGAFLLPRTVRAADIRTVPIDVNVIMDGSAAMRETDDAAINWVCDYVIDSLLQNGDFLNLWVAGEKAVTLFSDALKDSATKDQVKKLLRSSFPGSPSADFTGALQEASRISASRAGGMDGGSKTGSVMTYTLLIAASSAGLSPALLGPGASYMKYSRVMEFSGWRALIIALDVNSRVQNAAKAYMSGS
ncbi:hypothetical protein AGMMS50268_15540 [Spirochaetia bacterium]|nr:hypothetical protein AGMMS50268_15540 [Spirochaetia bacterium]